MPYPWLTESWRHLVRLSGDLPHALLIHGLRGIGKQALAMAFARFLLCETPTQALTSCGVCAGCRLLAADTHPDLRRVQPEFLDEDLTESATDTNRAKRSKTTRPSQEIKIDQIRELADFLNLGSHRGGRRIAIVQPAEDMNPNAANALLKGLEAPPPGAFFLLVSDEPARLLATVRSRCIGVPIAKPDRRSAESWLKEQHLEGGEVSNWLSLASGAPLAALAWANGPSAAEARWMMDALRCGDRDRLLGVRTREQIEVLSEVLQRYAYDRACTASGVPTLFRTDHDQSGQAQSIVPGAPAPWLGFAREMGKLKRLSRHPLNPQLFALELIDRIPE